METLVMDSEIHKAAGGAKGMLEHGITNFNASQSEKDKEAILDSLFEHVVYQNLEMEIMWANSAACESVGMTMADLQGRLCYEIWGGGDAPCEDCPVKQAVECGAPRQTEKRTPDGRSWLVRGYPVTADDGTVTGAVEVTLEITDYKQAEAEKEKLEKQLIQMQKMEAIGTLAGGIAHDFNNILFPIIGYTDLIMEAIGEDNTAYTQLQEVLKAATRARDLVRQILAFSRQNDDEQQSLKLQPVVKESLNLLKATLPSTIKIKHELNESCGPILGNTTQIHQIIMNLCTNAYHAMGSNGGQLDVCLKETIVTESDLTTTLKLKPGVYAKLAVSDTGCGMDKATLGRVFEPYFTTKKHGQGTGLGLSVVHGIVRKHNGYITVYSEPKKGTTFHIYFPRLENSPSAPEPVPVDQIPKGSERILLVDDEIQVLKVLQFILEDLGYTITSRINSIEAMELLVSESESFDLVITDQTMPAMTGIRLANMIRQIQPRLPVILCTGFSESVSKESIDANGIKALIMKPLVKSEIANVVRKVLDDM